MPNVSILCLCLFISFKDILLDQFFVIIYVARTYFQHYLLLIVILCPMYINENETKIFEGKKNRLKFVRQKNQLTIFGRKNEVIYV